MNSSSNTPEQELLDALAYLASIGFGIISKVCVQTVPTGSSTPREPIYVNVPKAKK